MLLVLKADLQTGLHGVNGVYEALRHGPRCCARYDMPHLHGHFCDVEDGHSIQWPLRSHS